MINIKRFILLSLIFPRLYKLLVLCVSQCMVLRLNMTFCKLLKLRLHYNELAQRTATVWRYLTFGDIRCYTLKKSDECDH